jgi:hypothetical protein
VLLLLGFGPVEELGSCIARRAYVAAFWEADNAKNF